ncbi:MAG TPA: hypothetical protein VFY36_12430 [Solirubrobacteraceae bacterium]|nr:hypothetical protein [Solirubrobacteraceae bacterium]
MSASLLLVTGALAALPDGRGYELVSPVQKNGVAPYAAVPSSTGGAVDFQARGAFAGATWGSLNLYQATRTAGGWQTVPLTPTPTIPLGSLEEQAPVWFSSDLSKTIFTTPQSYVPGDQDGGALSLYEQTPGDGLTWVSLGSQGGSEPNSATFDSATADGDHVVFSTGASLLPAAAGLSTEAAPEAEFLYERDVSGGQTNLLSLDASDQPAGYVATTLPEGYTPGFCCLSVANVEGFFPGQFITIGAGPSAEVTQIGKVLILEGVPFLEVENGSGLSSAFPPDTSVTHLAEGAILGDGGHLASGLPPAGEFLPANAGSGSTTNAISNDGSKAFFEAPNPAAGEPVGLYMRQDNSTTVKIAGAAPYGTTLSGAFVEETPVFGSARYQGAATNGSLVFFTSEEGLAGATPGRELYEFNTTSHAIGGAAPLSVNPVSTGLGGDQAPVTTLAAPGKGEAITVVSTAGFHAGEEILFAPFKLTRGRVNSNELATIASVDSATELTLTQSLTGVGPGIAAGIALHGVHPASLTAVSNDGSRVYFVSDGVLASNTNAQSATATPLQPNLYMFDTATGETAFIATLAKSDVSLEGSPTGLVGQPDISRPAVPTPDGGALVFASAANLTGQNPWQEFTEIYRYTVAGNSLTCLSCTAPGVKPKGNATFGETAGGTYDPPGLSSPMSDDGGRVFFQTPDSLVPEDTNGGAPTSPKFGTATSTDVYEWEAEEVSLISGGTSSVPAVLQGTTPSGDDVLFTTDAQLVPGQSDGGYENVFDARVGGGFPEAAKAAPSCVGASCRAAFGVAPVFAPPASTTPQGAGNLSPVITPKLTCRKGLVKKRVKGKIVCAKKRAKKARHGAGKTRREATRNKFNQ